MKMIGEVTGRASWPRAFRRLRADYNSSAGRGHLGPDAGAASPGVQDSSGNVLPDGIHRNGKESALIFGIVWRLLIFVAFVMMTFPPCFGRMGAGLDASWVLGLNEASSRHMIYGRDIIFTYGPLGFVIHPLDVGSNLIHATFFRLGLHALWWTSVGMMLLRIRGYSATLLFAAASLYSGIHLSPIFDTNSKLTGIIILTTIGYLMLSRLDRRPIWAVPAVVVSAAALLAKFNLGVACTVAIVVWGIIEFLRERSPRVLGQLGFLALTYVGAVAGLFRMYGGPIDSLGDFLRYSMDISSGYSSQMSFQGPAVEVMILMAVLGVAIIAAVVGILLRARYAPALLIILFPLFMLFKGAIVRHDFFHFLISFPPMIGLAAFMLPDRIGRWQSWAAQSVVALALLLGVWLTPPSVTCAVTRGALSWVQLCRYTETRAAIRADETHVKDQIKLPPRIRSRIGSETVDVYPWDLCYITANGLNWKPRFVLQSYSAYHPNLDQKCAEDYRGEDAPRYILYLHEAIDTQHPCIVDPQTWMEIYRWYDVVDQVNDILLLERRSSPRWDGMVELGSRSIAFGERWEVPENIREPVILRVKLRLNPIGKLSCILYKVYPPTIRVEYKDGSISEHRLVWQNVRSGFLVSNLPRDSNGVRLLMESPGADRVRAVTFRDDHGSFSRDFRVVWSRARMSPPRTPQPDSPIELSSKSLIDSGLGSPEIRQREIQ